MTSIARIICSSAAAICLLNAQLSAQQNNREWKTIIIFSCEPKELDSGFICQVQDRVTDEIKALPNADVSVSASPECTAEGFERIISVTVREIRKESSSAGKSGADRYLLKRIPPLYEIDAEIVIPDTGERSRASERFAGYSYSPEGTIFRDSFIGFYIKPRQQKEDTVIRDFFAAFSLTRESPMGPFREYSRSGKGFTFDGGLPLTRFPAVIAVFTSGYSVMKAEDKKISPYYMVPAFISSGYRFDLPSGFALCPSAGGGVIVHSISGMLYAKPSISVRLRALYDIGGQSSVFVQCGYLYFRDIGMNGQCLNLSLGYQWKWER